MFPTCYDRALLQSYLNDGLVGIKKHPDQELYIWNYTQTAQFSGKLKTEPVLRNLRGLIVNGQGKVIARGFPKFFNLGEDPEADARYQGKPFEVEEKLDGSMGIMYHDGYGWAIATRGSFTSDQAVQATAILNKKYKSWLDSLVTDMLVCFVFEIIYPENRIVVDYSGLEDLVLIGKLWIADGTDVPWRDSSWPGPVKKSWGFWHNADCIKDAFGPENKGKEGFVLVYGDGRRVKVKLDEYLRLHRIITGCNEKSVWEACCDNTIEELVENTPDEFYSWVAQIVADLTRQYNEHEAAARLEYARCRTFASDRKNFAAAATSSKYTSVLFCWLDQKGDKARRLLWDLVEPKGTGKKAYGNQEAD